MYKIEYEYENIIKVMILILGGHTEDFVYHMRQRDFLTPYFFFNKI